MQGITFCSISYNIVFQLTATWYLRSALHCWYFASIALLQYILTSSAFTCLQEYVCSVLQLAVIIYSRSSTSRGGGAAIPSSFPALIRRRKASNLNGCRYSFFLPNNPAFVLFSLSTPMSQPQQQQQRQWGVTAPISVAMPTKEELEQTEKLLQILRSHGLFESEQEAQKRWAILYLVTHSLIVITKRHPELSY